MSANRVEYHQGATSDVKSAVAWYQKRSSKAALDFIEELQRATDTIRQAPERWPIGRNNTRRFLLWRFPFSIIYSEKESVVTIWAVAHCSRRPEYWYVGFKCSLADKSRGRSATSRVTLSPFQLLAYLEARASALGVR